jgi:hypothetical protein
MSNATESPFDFAKAAKKFKPRAESVLAVKYKGAPLQVKTEHGSETAHEGDYIVQVGTHDATEIVPPSVKANGEKIPGLQKAVKVPVFEVMKSEDFDKLFEA